jgi:hypothetical protein
MRRRVGLEYKILPAAYPPVQVWPNPSYALGDVVATANLSFKVA